MTRKNTYTGILGVQAWCHDESCGWTSEARNALANAARHADAHPDHEVAVEQTLGITYNRRTDEEVLEAGRQCGDRTPHASHARAVSVRGRLVQSECPGVKA
jgi:hypothetical protein